MDSTLAEWMATIDQAIPTVAEVISSSSEAYDQMFGPVEEPGGVGPTIANAAKLPQPAPAAASQPAPSGNTGLIIVAGIVLALFLLR